MADTTIGNLNRQARGQLMMILAQFLVGMGVNLIGMPERTTGFPRVATIVLLALHVLIALGLLVGAVRAVAAGVKAGAPFASLAWFGGSTVLATVVVGIITMMGASGWWSYLMMVGAVASLVLYGVLFLRTQATSTTQSGA